MTRGVVAEKLMWLVVVGVFAVGVLQDWNPIACGVVMAVAVAGLEWWARR